MYLCSLVKSQTDDIMYNYVIGIPFLFGCNILCEGKSTIDLR